MKLLFGLAFLALLAHAAAMPLKRKNAPHHDDDRCSSIQSNDSIASRVKSHRRTSVTGGSDSKSSVSSHADRTQTSSVAARERYSLRSNDHHTEEHHPEPIHTEKPRRRRTSKAALTAENLKHFEQTSVHMSHVSDTEVHSKPMRVLKHTPKALDILETIAEDAKGRLDRDDDQPIPAANVTLQSAANLAPQEIDWSSSRNISTIALPSDKTPAITPIELQSDAVPIERSLDSAQSPKTDDPTKDPTNLLADASVLPSAPVHRSSAPSTSASHNSAILAESTGSPLVLQTALEHMRKSRSDSDAAHRKAGLPVPHESGDEEHTSRHFTRSGAEWDDVYEPHRSETNVVRPRMLNPLSIPRRINAAMVTGLDAWNVDVVVRVPVVDNSLVHLSKMWMRLNKDLNATSAMLQASSLINGPCRALLPPITFVRSNDPTAVVIEAPFMPQQVIAFDGSMGNYEFILEAIVNVLLTRVSSYL